MHFQMANCNYVLLRIRRSSCETVEMAREKKIQFDFVKRMRRCAALTINSVQFSTKYFYSVFLAIGHALERAPLPQLISSHNLPTFNHSPKQINGIYRMRSFPINSIVACGGRARRPDAATIARRPSQRINVTYKCAVCVRVSGKW